MRILLTPAPPPEEEDEGDLDGLEVDVRRSGVFMTEVKDKEKRLSMGSVKVTNLDEVIQAAEVEGNREEVTDKDSEDVKSPRQLLPDVVEDAAAAAAASAVTAEETAAADVEEEEPIYAVPDDLKVCLMSVCHFRQYFHHNN